jgi:hypothetical protein
MLTRSLNVPIGKPQLTLAIGHLHYRPWRLQVFVDDDNLRTQIVGAEESTDPKQVPPNASQAVPLWDEITLDLSPYAGRTVTLRLYHWLAENQIPGAAYWRRVRVE